jgi:RimJ/RimL family protein N-acetyltransferase
LNLELVEYTHDFLLLSNKWLNDTQIKQLTNSITFTPAQQIQWFNELPNKANYLIWGITLNAEKVGACGLKKVNNIDAEYWGYIGEKKYWGKGYGSEILKIIEKKATQLHLKSIWLTVMLSNTNAIKLYTKNGFMLENKEEHFQTMRKIL